MSDTTALLLLIFLVVILNLISIARNWRKVEYLTKPGVMLLLLGWLFLQGDLHSQLIWFAVGAFFSLVGDILLMLPINLFVPGLVSFLIAHLAYLAGFLHVLPEINLAAGILFALVAVSSVQYYRRLATGLEKCGQTSLRAPIIIYTTSISLMVFSALLTLLSDQWGTAPAVLVSAGALLFFLSDSTLAWCRFVSPLKNSALAVMSTYHLGQIGIIVGAALQFSGN